MNSTQRQTEAEIDNLVIAAADDDSAWEEAVHVHKTVPRSLQLPAELAERAAFLAQLHRARSLEAWLTRIIEERVELEEGAFLQAKRELAGVSAV